MLNDTVNQIGPLDKAAMQAAEKHQNSLAIPLRSLGRLHEFGIRMAGITGNPRPTVAAMGVITMAGDHGVVAQGVSKFPQEVTREMIANFCRGGAAINVLSRQYGIRLTVVDVGVAGPMPDMAISIDNTAADQPAVRFARCRVADGTDDFSVGPAMTRDQARQALEVGIRIFREEKAKGMDAVGTGDMGIGNTTPSSVIAACLLNRQPGEVVNRGTGIDDEALKNKIDVVARALAVNQPDPDDPLDVLSKIGGYEIGGIAGVILAACAARTPVVIDGFISTAAALLASRFNPNVKDYMFAGHQSAVEGHRLMLDDLGLSPMVDLGLRLGEGTGAVFGLSILSASSAVAREMLTFEEAAVSEPDVEEAPS